MERAAGAGTTPAAAAGKQRRAPAAAPLDAFGGEIRVGTTVAPMLAARWRRARVESIEFAHPSGSATLWIAYKTPRGRRVWRTVVASETVRIVDRIHEERA